MAKKKMGRPRIEIDWSQFDKLCHMQCTLSEIASFFDCSEDTIERRVKEEFGVTFAEHYAKKAARGKISLRRKQFETAMAGNTTMLIWLGKQHLDQKEKVQNTNETTHKGEVTVTKIDIEERLSQLKGD